MTEVARTVFVTGCPRSGTTWFGRVLSAHRGARYVHEPFNPNSPHPATSFRTKEFFERIPMAERERLDLLEPIFSGRTRLFSRPPGDTKFSTWLKWSVSEVRFQKPTLTVVKDPIAILSVESIAEYFNPQMIFMFRRPEAVVSSFLRRGWDVQLDRFIQIVRPSGIWSDDQLDDAENSMDSPLDRVAHIWRLLAVFGLHLREKYPDWLFLRYEDVTADPCREFRRLCDLLGLEFEGDRENFLTAIDRPSRKSPGSQRVLDVRRSRSDFQDPDTILESAENRRVKDICGPELQLLYPETFRAGTV